jgi:hypothetical protein
VDTPVSLIIGREVAAQPYCLTHSPELPSICGALADTGGSQRPSVLVLRQHLMLHRAFLRKANALANLASREEKKDAVGGYVALTRRRFARDFAAGGSNPLNSTFIAATRSFDWSFEPAALDMAASAKAPAINAATACT